MSGAISMIGGVQQAIHTKLGSSVVLNGAAVPVKANLSKNTVPPYIVLDPMTEVPDNRADTQGSQVTVTVQLVTRGDGYFRYADVNSGISQIRALLEIQTIKYAGASGEL